MKDFRFSPGCRSPAHTLFLNPMVIYMISLTLKVFEVMALDEVVEVWRTQPMWKIEPRGLGRLREEQCILHKLCCGGHSIRRTAVIPHS